MTQQARISPAKKNYTADFVLMCMLLCLSFVWSVCSGSVNIGIGDLSDIITGDETKKVYHQIIFNIRLPKAITAVLCGCALSVCGLLMQTLFRNPLAGPYILGINSGASLFVAFVIAGAPLLGLSRDSFIYSGGIAFAASAGAICTLLIILGISFRIKSNVILLLTGIMLGYIYGAIQNLFEYFANPGDLKTFVMWGMGSLQNVNWEQLTWFAPLTFAGILAAVLLTKPLNLFLLGNNYAQSSGLNVPSAKWKIIIVTGILSGTATAFCGPIAFIGLAVPHLARILLKSNQHGLILPASAILGASTLLICDALGNLAPEGMLIPVNVTTSLIGAPIVIWLLLKNRNMSAD